MTVLNCTPHPLVFYRKEDTYFDASSRKLYLKDGAKPMKEIPPSGKVLNLKLEAEKTSEIEGGISIYEQKIVGADAIPEADVVIVSAMFASNYKGKRDRLYIIYGPVYQDPSNPRPVGCLGLQKVE